MHLQANFWDAAENLASASPWESSFAPSLDVGGLSGGGRLASYGSGSFGDDGFNGSHVYEGTAATAGSPGMLIPMVGGGVAPMSSTSDLAFSNLQNAEDAQYGMAAYGSAGLMHEALMSHGNDAQAAMDSVTSFWQPQGNSAGPPPLGATSNRQPKIEKKVPSTIACRYGIKCHSKTCAFWHPPGRGLSGAESFEALDYTCNLVSAGKSLGPASPSRKAASIKMYEHRLMCVCL